MKEITIVYGIPEETVKAFMMLCMNTIKLTYGDTDFSDKTSGVLQGDTLSLYLFTIYLY